MLCEVAYQFLIPQIDISAEIGLSDTQVQSVDTRVSLVGPGRPCMVCSGVVSRDRVRLEGYSDIEQDRVLKMGDSTDIRLKAPNVMDVNMRAASMAMLVIRHFLQRYLLTPLPLTIKEAVTSFSMRTRQHSSCGNCTICGTIERIGIGNGARLTTRTTGGNFGPPTPQRSAKRRRMLRRRIVLSLRCGPLCLLDWEELIDPKKWGSPLE